MEATGVLLVGGLSRRFGSVKALAPLGDETLAERGWRVLGEAFSERIALCKWADQLGLPFPTLDDEITVRAPIAGVVAGLRAAPTHVAVFLPVDCPLVTPHALHALAEACTDAAVPQTGPLPGAYRKTALPALETGELSLRRALEGLEVATIAIDPAILANINTPDELRALHQG